jgi:serine/threonine protein kinase
VKIIKSSKKYLKQSQTELKILFYLKKEAEKRTALNFVNVLASFKFRKHLCIVFELLSFTLYDLLKANSFKGFSSGLIRRFCVQLLTALSILRQSRVIHCDLKPENIALVNPYESAIKLIDFGSSCFEEEKIYYYIQSRIYRAPEVILGVPYTAAIDIWSLGCILVELSTGSPLFISENEEDQLNAIIEVIGHPPIDLIESGLKAKKFLGPKGKIKNAATPTGKLRIPDSRRLEDVLVNKDPSFVDLVKSKK